MTAELSSSTQKCVGYTDCRASDGAEPLLVETVRRVAAVSTGSLLH